jgi:hypothetical protein
LAGRQENGGVHGAKCFRCQTRLHAN